MAAAVVAAARWAPSPALQAQNLLLLVCLCGRRYARAQVPCGWGRYRPSGSSSCQQCQGGHYTAGASGAGVSAGATQCISCPSGKYNTVADSSCESCSAGSFTTRTANDNDGTGDTYGSMYCENCPPGKYNTVADSICESCSAGSFTTRTANDNDGWGSLYSSRYCYPCPAGKHNPTADQSCGSCSSGKFTADASGVGVSTGATQCNDCPLGKYNTVADSSCESCSAGHFTTRTSSDRDGSGHQTSSSYCNACPAGMHNPTGDHICDDCSAGYFTAGSAADNDGVGVIDGATHCNLCPAGSYSFGTSSSFFSGGHQVTAQWCRPCSPGRYEPAAGQADDCSQQHTTYQCVPGFGWSGSTTIDDGNCAVCQPGRYSSVTATAVCTACSAGSMTDGLGEAGTGYMVAQQKASTTYLPKCWDPGALASVTCCRDVNGNSNGACPASGSTQPFGLRNCASICTEAD
jgi:hypothetical protein